MTVTRYREDKNKWRDNVKINNGIVGRKFFTLLSITRVSDVLTMIKWSKQSLMTEYIKQLIQKYNYQDHLQIIDDELEKIFQMFNQNINQLGAIELVYEVADMWDIVQKTNLIGVNETLLDDKGNFELLLIFLNLLEEVIKVAPKKMLVIMENIDHLITKKEYRDILVRIQKIGMKYDIYFILSTSIDGYVECDKSLCEGISIFGDVDFQMPEFYTLLSYIHDNYPYNKKFSEKQFQDILEKIIHKIGQKEFLCNVEENVVCKLINRTLMLNEKWKNVENILEIAFLKA